jgi:DNA-directed RNA polymerase specialized sigma24 family protein
MNKSKQVFTVMRLSNTDSKEFGRLLACAQQGDRRSYTLLLESLSSAVRLSVYERLSEEAAREKLVQKILSAVHAARHTFRPSTCFRRWFFAIVRRELIEFFAEQPSSPTALFRQLEAISDEELPTPQRHLLRELRENLRLFRGKFRRSLLSARVRRERSSAVPISMRIQQPRTKSRNKSFGEYYEG